MLFVFSCITVYALGEHNKKLFSYGLLLFASLYVIKTY